MSLVLNPLNPSAPCFVSPTAALAVDTMMKVKQTGRSTNLESAVVEAIKSLEYADSQLSTDQVIKKPTHKLPAKPPPVDFGVYGNPSAAFDGLSTAFDSQKSLTASPCTPSKEVRRKQRKRRVISTEITPEYAQSTEAAKLLPKIPLKKNYRWTSRSKSEEEALVRVRQGAETLKFANSPFVPKSLKDLFILKEGLIDDNKKYIEKLIEKQKPRGPKLTISCMGGKTFDTNLSAVLSMRTMWCPQTWPDTQEEARWPCGGELRTEGSEREESKFGRFFPVPRSEQFAWELRCAYDAGMTHKDFRPWDGEGECPFQQRRFAMVRSGLDMVWGMGREMDAEEIYGRPQEIDDEDIEGMVGKALVDELEV